MYKLKKIVGSDNFSAQFIKIISHYNKIGYNFNVLQQTACLVVNSITVGNFAFLFNCTPVGRTKIHANTWLCADDTSLYNLIEELADVTAHLLNIDLETIAKMGQAVDCHIKLL